MSERRGSVRRMLDIKPAHHRTRPLLTGSIVIGIIVFALLSAAIRHVPGTPRPGRDVKAEFAAANQVSNRTVVRVNGVEVGRVSKVQAGADPRRASLVTMRLTNDDVVLHSDAAAQIRWRTLFGGLMYIELNPGSASAPKLGNRPIPVAQTSNQVEFDQVLQPYDGATDDHQRTVLKELRAVLSDPAGTQRTLRTLPALTTVEQGVNPYLGRDSDDLGKLVASASKTVKGLGDTAGLKTLVSGGAQTTGALAHQRNNLGRFIDDSPPSLDSTYTTMRRVRTTLVHLDALAADLRPGARALDPAARAATPTFRHADAVLRQVRPLVRDAGPAFDSLHRAGASGTPLMKGLDPTLNRLDSELLPYLRKRDNETHLKLYETIGPFWSALAMSAAEFDSEGHRIRFTVPPQSNSYINTPPTQAVARSCRSSAGAGAPCDSIARLLAANIWGKTAVRKASR